MQADLDRAFQLVTQPTNQSIKAGQAILHSYRSNVNYPIILLSYMKDAQGYEPKLRAAIELRIWCENYKNIEQFERATYSPIIEDVKTNILFAFLSFDEKIEKTLLPGIVALTAVEFPDRWKVLISGLITYASQNPGSILKILELMVEVTNKYSYLTRSDPLYHEIIIVCNQFQGFLLNLTNESVNHILKNQANPVELRILEQEMILFYNLNYQDLHPEFEDNLPQWMSILKRVMVLPNTNENFFKCKGAALQSILLYASKYKDDVGKEIESFSQEIWTLCANASPDPEYDDIVFNALKYFRSLIMWQDMREFFSSSIPTLISNLILPNLKFNNHYKDLFQEEIQTFISYFFRNSELSSRRSAAIQLLQAIVRNFKTFQQFIEDQIKGFTPGDDNSQGQCLLLNLVIESAAKGFRDVDGVTQLQINGNIIVYCYEQFIKATLNTIYQKCSESPDRPIEKLINLVQLITTLRFIFYFRIYLPTEELNLILRLCCNMNSNSESLQQVLLLVVNSIVTLKHGNFTLYKNIVYFYDENKLKQIAGDVLTMVANYEAKTTQPKDSINKLLYSTVKQLKQHNEIYYDSHLGGIIKSMLCKTSTYDFNSILPLFQALGYLCYYLCSMKSAKCGHLEQLTQQYFHQMIKSQSDILNFCFQILSIFLQFNPGDPAFYEQLYASIIRPENWNEENISIMSSYLQYIAAFVAINQQRIISDKQSYETLLSKLIELDHYELFYRLLRRVLKLTDLEGFFKYGYMHVLVKGTEFIAAKSLEGRKTGLLFIFEITYEYNTDTMVKAMNEISPGFYEKLLLANQDIIQSMQVLRNRKMMFGSICNALVSRCFSSVQSEGEIINLLIENSTCRFRRDFTSTVNEHAPKKQSTYQKLAVFKEIENVDRSITLDEEGVLVQAYSICSRNNSQVGNFIGEKNMQRIKKMYERQQAQSG